MMNCKKNLFLFSVDLEDIRLRMSDGVRYSARVEQLVFEYLAFLNQYGFKATFFVVGDIPKVYPNLIYHIQNEGHEIACHSNLHIPLTKMDKVSFRDDIVANVDNLINAGAGPICGFRAPVFSLVKETSWAFEVLSDLGFSYSSSVLPAKNPLFGWENFGSSPVQFHQNFWEIPMSVRGSKLLNVPFAGGIYFRILPLQIISNSFKNHFAKNEVVTSYFHPYDIDSEQEFFMHPGINDNRFYNQLMYYNRGKVFKRLDYIIKKFDCEIITYRDYVTLLNTNCDG
ncbi:polysaccharide deacetylase family protein [Flavobacterium lacisediminis]|uniref:Polysaccharide deacetylase family protein n=1 Tax=Flavobacterium lacisediminis TaxID=2989705 RepID=A0ABT3EL21_9FLAO|nr:polysaccharide deacetylase family protein [Flavobacterium lacisediminis]MCW1148829.1 polysaccharide deacetylase family protein [Flavobacterium lacisediminis]